MRKIIAAINMTIDGVCDHTKVLPDEEIHEHYRALLTKGDAILYGRITYQLMQYWQSLLNNPSGERSMDDFAIAIDRIPKIVFSHTLKDTGWDSAVLSDKPLKEKILELKHQQGKDIFIGSRSLIIQLINLNMVDELQLCVHPVLAGGGLLLFEHITDRTILKLVNIKTFSGGAIILYYEPKNQ